MNSFKKGYLIGILWTTGLLLISKINTEITNGQYASGIAMLLMTLWLAGALSILLKRDNEVKQ